MSAKTCGYRWDGPPAFGLQHQEHGEHECRRPVGHQGLCMCACSTVPNSTLIPAGDLDGAPDQFRADNSYSVKLDRDSE
jgi:hypothetical protein